MDAEALIQEQIEYYRKRAPEYDETSPLADEPLSTYAQQIQHALHRFAPSGRVLEIASGTGKGTSQLLEHSSSVTAIDSSPEMHDLSRERLGDDGRVRYVVADIFSWQPSEVYDVIFFSYWLSHVPPKRFDHFWDLVRQALAPAGRVFFIDELKDAWRNEEHLREDFVHDPSVPIVRRPLLDGRTFNVVKVFWDPNELKNRLVELGWAMRVQTAGPFFWAEGYRSTPG